MFSFLRSLVILVCVVALPCSASASFVIGYDDALDSAYDFGWTNGSNGGYGFGAWNLFYLANFGTGDSNTNGTFGGPGINTGGRAWKAQQAAGWGGAVGGRGIGMFNPGDALEIDVDFGAVPDPGQGVAVFGASDVCQVQAIGSPAGSNLRINTNTGTLVTAVPYGDGGFRVTFDHVAAGSLDVTILSLASSISQTYSVAYAPGVGTHFLSMQANNPSAGQELYANRMRLTSPVPEPTTLTGLGLALALLACRRRR